MFQDQVLPKMNISSLHELDIIHKLLHLLLLSGLDVGSLVGSLCLIVDFEAGLG